MITPYYADDQVTLYLGDCRKVIPQLGVTFDCIVADPPYQETSLAWDRWPDGWPTIAATATSSMWCFGSMRMFLDRRDEFAAWKLSQDVVWEKHIGSGFTTDRFMRVHEYVTHWYRGAWRDLYRVVPRQPAQFDAKGRTSSARRDDRAAHTGAIAATPYVDDGLRLARSVLRIKSIRGIGGHPTEKPVDLLKTLVEYACPAGGTVLDPFPGSGSTAVAARMSGRKTVLIEKQEHWCEAIVRRLQQDVLPLATA
jgi:site-specific DNA-methyltransferase (adenine-specific)